MIRKWVKPLRILAVFGGGISVMNWIIFFLTFAIQIEGILSLVLRYGVGLTIGILGIIAAIVFASIAQMIFS